MAVRVNLKSLEDIEKNVSKGAYYRASKKTELVELQNDDEDTTVSIRVTEEAAQAITDMQLAIKKHLGYKPERILVASSLVLHGARQRDAKQAVRRLNDSGWAELDEPAEEDEVEGADSTLSEGGDAVHWDEKQDQTDAP